MPIPKKFQADFTEGNIFHVYSRTNNKELLFRSDENRRFFMQRYDALLSPYVNTYCWCLLANHFHLLVRIKTIEEISATLRNKQEMPLTVTETKFLNNETGAGEITEQAFERFFQSYALAFNKMYNRSGNLFYRPFKRVLGEKGSHFTQTVIYIHSNPVKHHITADFTRYDWSS
jgi:putative transposase